LYLGKLYYEGLGTLQDYVEAAKWYRKAAENGNALAQLWLGTMYISGQGVPVDLVQAHLWLNLAATNYVSKDWAVRKSAEKDRAAIETRMTQEQIDEALRLKREWTRKTDFE